ncbi:hypothetical protein GGF43_005983, partial [Coemansia sp. RSA 2618]
YNVVMSCTGCSGAVKKALEKNGVTQHDISLKDQTVVVEDSDELFQEEAAAIVDEKEKREFKYNKLLEIITKTGKKVILPEVPSAAELPKAAEAA